MRSIQEGVFRKRLPYSEGDIRNKGYLGSNRASKYVNNWKAAAAGHQYTAEQQQQQQRRKRLHLNALPKRKKTASIKRLLRGLETNKKLKQ